MIFQSKTEKFRSRTNIFNLLRLLLAVMVIFSHSYPLLYGVTVFDPIEHALHVQKDIPNDHPIDAGHLAVYGFFIISGYLVTMSWQNSRGIWKYLKNRILRICPGFVATVLVCALVIAPFVAVHRGTYYHDLLAGKKEFLLSLLFLKGVWTPPVLCGALNGSLWTICYEFSCYLMIALLGSLAFLSRRILPSRLHRVAPAMLFIGFYVLYCFHCGGHWLGSFGLMDGHSQLENSHWGRRLIFVMELAGDPVTWSRQFAYFAAGMCLYLYRDILLNSRILVWLSVTVLLASAFLLPLLAYTLPIFGAYALVSLCLIPNQSLSRVGQKADLSYGLYLYAFPVQQMIVLQWHSHLTPLTLFLLALPCTCVLATLSWYLVEQPFLKRKSHVRQNEEGLGRTQIENQLVTAELQQAQVPGSRG